MNLLNVYQQRRSVRSFEYHQITATDWSDILEAGRIAATSRNKQARRFVTLTRPEDIKNMVSDAKMQSFLTEASALVVACTTEQANSGVDAIISLAQMEAVAVSKGLGTIWLGVFDRDVVAQKINLPTEYKVVLMMAFGYAAEVGQMPIKLSKEELFYEGSFPGNFKQ